MDVAFLCSNGVGSGVNAVGVRVGDARARGQKYEASRVCAVQARTCESPSSANPLRTCSNSQQVVLPSSPAPQRGCTAIHIVDAGWKRSESIARCIIKYLFP